MTGAPLVITPGEPAGIGPDLVIQLCQQTPLPHVIVANREMLAARAAQLGLPLTLREWSPGTPTPTQCAELLVHSMPLEGAVQPGKLNGAHAHYVLDCLDTAIDGCLNGTFAGLVTGPVHKGIINEAGVTFSGHTEHLQHRCGVDRVVMMLATQRLRVALVTTHLPLKDVATAITQERLRQVTRILLHDLRHTFGIAQPRILVAGLNPHAGEDGHLGREEIDIITPVMRDLDPTGERLIGPLPADTLFTPKHLDQADAVLAMYHDQGLPVLKFQGFGEAVNITLGLPIVRTSVDHGTALDLAGSGTAHTGSLRCAIEQAVSMACSHTMNQDK